MAECPTLRHILDENLISCAALARAAGVGVGTVRSLLGNRRVARRRTRRAVLDALNDLLTKKGKRSVGPEVFGSDQPPTEERKTRDREWLDSPNADLELGKRKYRGKYLYIACEGVAGYGETMHKARDMARRRTGINPAEMIQMLVPSHDVDL